MASRETEDNAYAKFWGDKQRPLWYVMVFSGVVNCRPALVSINSVEKLVCVNFGKRVAELVACKDFVRSLLVMISAALLL